MGMQNYQQGPSQGQWAPQGSSHGGYGGHDSARMGMGYPMGNHMMMGGGGFPMMDPHMMDPHMLMMMGMMVRATYKHTMAITYLPFLRRIR